MKKLKCSVHLFLAALSLSLTIEQSIACESTNGHSPNMAEYVYNSQTNQWHLVASWYDPVYNYYTPDPDDYTFTIGSPQDPAGPGGGWQNPQPPTQPYDVKGSRKGAELNPRVTSCTLPPMVVTVAVMSGPTFGWSRFVRIFPAGGSGGAHSRVVAGLIPPSPANEVRTDCHANRLDRWFSAVTDVNHFCAASPSRCRGGVPRMPTVTVTYSDDSTKAWPTAPNSTLKLHQDPVPGSMKGCD